MIISLLCFFFYVMMTFELMSTDGMELTYKEKWRIYSLYGFSMILFISTGFLKV